MIDISYDTIYSIYSDFFSNQLNLGELVIALKVLAVSFFLLNIYTNMFSRIGTTLGQAKLPFDERKLLSSLVVVLAVVFYDKLLDVLDGLLLNFDQTYAHFSPLDFAPPEEELNDETTNEDVWATMKEAASAFLVIMSNPSHLVVLAIEGIAWMIDTAVYVVFLMERFFFIGLLKVLGSLAIVLAVFDKFRDLCYKWLKLYIAVYLLILPFFLIIGFTASIFEYFDKMVGLNSVSDFFLGSGVRSTVLIIMIWLKLRLFKKSYDMVYKLFV